MHFGDETRMAAMLPPAKQRTGDKIRDGRCVAGATTVKPRGCAEKRHLYKAYVQAVGHALALQKDEMAHFLKGGDGKGDDGVESYDAAIKQARRKLDRAKKLYVLHLQTHAC